MDGGVVDNQGIEPVLLANDRMKRNKYGPSKDNHKDKPNILDLIIVNDVASPYMEDYKASKQKRFNWWRRLSLSSILLINSLVLIASICGMFYSIFNQHIFLGIVSSLLFTLTTIITLVGIYAAIKVAKSDLPLSFLVAIDKLLRLKLGVFENLICKPFSNRY